MLPVKAFEFVCNISFDRVDDFYSDGYLEVDISGYDYF